MTAAVCTSAMALVMATCAVCAATVVSSRLSGDGDERDVLPLPGAATTVMTGMEVTVKPAGMMPEAADASARLGAKLLRTASAAALVSDWRVISRWTEAAVTVRVTRL